MAVSGVGVDIVSIARMEKILQRSPNFAHKVFWEQERAYCDTKSRPAVHYAVRWAAREAVLKSLGLGFGRGVRYRDVEILTTPQKRPEVVLHGKLKAYAEEQGIMAIHVSLSHSGDHAVANAISMTEQSVPKKEKKVDPKAELQANFRELKFVLDELDQYQQAALESVDKAQKG